jgi:hypothetical protein
VAGTGPQRRRRRADTLDAGLSQARRRVGPAPLAALFARLRGPQAAPGAAGAFVGALRLVSWDATMLDVPDSPANQAAFIASGNTRGRGAYPKSDCCN